MAGTPQQYFREGAFRVDPSQTARSAPTQLSGGPRGNISASFQQAPERLTTEAVDREAAINQATFNAINKMGQSIIEPMVARKQQELFYEGARRQVEGEALADIVDEQPWYSKIFGPSASAQGARKMAQLRGVDEVVNSLALDMPELRKLDGDGFQQEMFKRLKAVDTGDEQTDGLIQAQVIESSQALLTAHTKEHYAWNQEQTQKEFTASSLVNAEQLQQGAQSHQKGILNDDNYANLKLKVANSLQPIEGQTEESYFASIMASGTEAMQKGQWHYVQLMEDAGVVSAMPAEQRIQFQNAKRQYQNQTMSDLATDTYHLQLAELTAKSQAGLISPNAVLAGVKQLNAEVKAKTGIDRDFLDGNDVEGLIQGNLRGLFEQQQKAKAAAQDRQAKMQAEQAENLLTMKALGTGSAGNLQSAGVVSGSKLQAAGSALVNQALSTGDTRTMLPVVINNFNGSNFKIDALENEVQRGFRNSQGEDFNPQWVRSMQLYAQLNEQPGGQAAATAYAGQFAGQAQQAYEMHKGGLDWDVAYSRVNNTTPAATLSKAESTKMAEVVDDKFGGSWWPLSDDGIDESAKQQITNLMAPAMKQFSGTSLTTDEQFDRAWPQVESKFNILGKRGVHKNPSDPALYNVLAGGVSKKEAGTTFDQVYTKKIKELGISEDANNRITQQRTAGGLQYIVETYEDGQVNWFQINQDELEDEFKRSVSKQRSRKTEPTGMNWAPQPGTY